MRLTPQYGTSGYWIDFAAQHTTRPGRYVLAIECDGATYHSSESARDRDRLRQQQVEVLGWRFPRVWSSAWFRIRDAAVGRVVAAYKEAVRDADDARARVAMPIAPASDQSGRSTKDAEPLRGPRPDVEPGLPIDAYSIPKQAEQAKNNLLDIVTKAGATAADVTNAVANLLRAIHSSPPTPSPGASGAPGVLPGGTSPPVSVTVSNSGLLGSCVSTPTSSCTLRCPPSHDATPSPSPSSTDDPDS